MIRECSHSNEESGKTAAEGIFKSERRPTAILATSDRLAIGVIEAAVDHQLRVPQDLAVVGFDDIPAANLITPQLTTVHQPMAEKGRSAVSMLLQGKFTPSSQTTGKTHYSGLYSGAGRPKEFDQIIPKVSFYIKSSRKITAGFAPPQ